MVKVLGKLRFPRRHKLAAICRGALRCVTRIQDQGVHLHGTSVYTYLSQRFTGPPLIQKNSVNERRRALLLRRMGSRWVEPSLLNFSLCPNCGQNLRGSRVGENASQGALLGAVA